MISIVVRNVEDMNKYFTRLKETRQELEDLLTQMNDDCRRQARNWEDEQYRTFEETLTDFTRRVTDLMEDSLQDAIDIAADVLERLK